MGNDSSKFGCIVIVGAIIGFAAILGTCFNSGEKSTSKESSGLNAEEQKKFEAKLLAFLDPIRKAADRPKTRRSLRMNHSLKIK